MKETEKMEMGGYLSFELNDDGEYYKNYDPYTLKVNSGRTAIFVILQNVRPKRILIPYFYCPSVEEFISELNIPIIKYDINKQFMPEKLDIKEGDMLILVNYFGLYTDNINQVLQAYPDKNIIVDNSQAFYAAPIMKKNIYNVYSCRKFFGVTDGAYVISQNPVHANLEKGRSSGYINFILRQIEEGTNACYKENLKNEERLASQKELMSDLTKRILRSIDYARAAERRRSNFIFLEKRLSFYQMLRLKLDQNVPYMYPLLCEYNIRKRLVEEHIYVPVLWKELLDGQYQGTTEQYLSQNILYLPLDQRYSDKELEYMARLIEKLIHEEGNKQ